ncbi:uncharacterized protein [Mytilus edulis]|uniref:uncharacterized protein n=1 Tax=Mytilus edulis TaxID=6550 RepID=UPI0039EFAAE8
MKLIFVEELKTFLFTNFLPFSGCEHCRHCHIQCDVHTNAPLPVVTGSPITTSKPHSSTCDIVAIFDAVARNQFVENVNATTCLNGKGRHGNDALVMTLCNAPESARWIEGEQVLFRDGTCSESAKPYTPIFYHQDNVRLAGILISCSGSEIRYFYQKCDTTPVVYVNSNGIERVHVLTWT